MPTRSGLQRFCGVGGGSRRNILPWRWCLGIAVNVPGNENILGGTGKIFMSFISSHFPFGSEFRRGGRVSPLTGFVIDCPTIRPSNLED